MCEFCFTGRISAFFGVVPFFFQLRKEQNGNSRLKFQHVTTNITSPGMPVRKNHLLKVLFTNYRDLLTFKMQIDKLDFNLLKCELCRNVTLFMWKMPYVLDYMNNSVFGNIISNTPAHKTTN